MAMTRFVYDYQGDYIKEIDLLYSDDFMTFFMQPTQARSDFVCRIHANCQEQNYTRDPAMSH